MKEARRLRRGQVRIDRCGTCRMSQQCDVPCIAPNSCDMLLNPAHAKLLVQEAIIPTDTTWISLRQSASCHEAQHTKTVLASNQYDVLGQRHKILDAVVSRRIASL